MTPSNITRRSWIARVASALFAWPAAKSAVGAPLPFYGTLTSDHPMAPDVDVRDQYGNTQKLVRAVNVEEGWIDQYITDGDGKIKTLLTTDECLREQGIRHVSCAGLSCTIPVRRKHGKFTIHRRVK